MNKSFTFVALVALLSGCTTNEPKYRVGSESTSMSRSEAEGSITKIQPQVPAAWKLDSPPRILSSKFPDYPQDFRVAQIEGEVTVQFYIEPDGTVSNPTVVGAPSPGLAALSLQAIMQWKFAPAKRDGAAVRVRAEQVFRFKLE